MIADEMDCFCLRQDTALFSYTLQVRRTHRISCLSTDALVPPRLSLKAIVDPDTHESSASPSQPMNLVMTRWIG